MTENTITISFEISPAGYKVFDLSSLGLPDAAGMLIDAAVEVSQKTQVSVGAILLSTIETCPDLHAVGYDYKKSGE